MKKLKMTTQKLTFSEGCNKYLEYCRQRNLRQGTTNHYKQSYTQFFKHFDPKMPIEDIDEHTYKDYVLHLKSTLDNDISINSYLRDLIIIIKEFYTGTTQSRPQWDKLTSQIKTGDTIVFDSVSRMSRNAEEGFKDYKMLYELGVNLIFLNEPLINTSVFDSTRNNLLNVNIETGNTAVDDFFKGNIQLINNFMMALAEEQIKTAFEQSEKEVTDLHSRISQGMREAKKNGTQIGLTKGATLTTKKSVECKAIIKKHSKDFGGNLEDPDVIKLCGCSRNSYYKYKREIKAQGSR